MSSPSSESGGYFCTEPWLGVLAVETNRDVTFCPCYLQLKIGNLDEASMQEIWNSEQLVELRRDFSRGVLPEMCRDKVCPVARGGGSEA